MQLDAPDLQISKSYKIALSGIALVRAVGGESDRHKASDVAMGCGRWTGQMGWALVKWKAVIELKITVREALDLVTFNRSLLLWKTQKTR